MLGKGFEIYALLWGGLIVLIVIGVICGLIELLIGVILIIRSIKKNNLKIEDSNGYCTNCGKMLNTDSKYCTNCGKKK